MIWRRGFWLWYTATSCLSRSNGTWFEKKNDSFTLYCFDFHYQGKNALSLSDTISTDATKLTAIPSNLIYLVNILTIPQFHGIDSALVHQLKLINASKRVKATHHSVKLHSWRAYFPQAKFHGIVLWQQRTATHHSAHIFFLHWLENFVKLDPLRSLCTVDLSHGCINK